MIPFNKKLLMQVVSTLESLTEREKATGLEFRVLARALTADLEIAPGFEEKREFRGSDPFYKMYNAVNQLQSEELIKLSGKLGGVVWLLPTSKGRDLVETWEKDARSPIADGKQLLEYLYGLQQDEDEIARREGVVEGINVNDTCVALGIDEKAYVRAGNWAIRQGFAGVRSTAGNSVESGGIYITTEGMTAYEKGFIEGPIQTGPTINIHDSKVIGNILAAGRDAMLITNPEISGSGAEIIRLLEEIQDAIEDFEDEDDRHDALQEVESLQREFSKPDPVPGRIERSLDAIGSIASIGTVAAPQLARLLELAQQLSL